MESSLYKIIIDFKDGSTAVLQRPINNVSNDTSWMTIDHTFNFKNEPEGNYGIIDMHLYYLYGTEKHIKLKFIIKGQSLQNQDVKLSLVNANMDNNKKVSYIFNYLNENQLLLARRDSIK